MPEELRALEARLRRLPSVDSVLQARPSLLAMERYGRRLTTEAVRAILEQQRKLVIQGQVNVPDAPQIAADAASWLARTYAPTLREVINATGIIVHTNLGRAPLSEAVSRSIASIAAGYSTLEYDLKAGARGSRAVHAEAILTKLTGAEAALVVNNNAAAVLLMLTALCQGRRVIISRGQLVEIGGGFRVPDVMAQSGAQLVEVGTTNRTHLRDYENAIDGETAAILVAHHSNYKIIGFTREPKLGELSALALRKGILLLYDQGSGALIDTKPYGLAEEPTVGDGLKAGVDLVAFSGDKLLGGPQAGIICGRKDALATLKRHPLARAVRADKLALAALVSTLQLHLADKQERIPIWRMIAQPLAEIAERAEGWSGRLREAGVACRVEDGLSAVGGGSLPGATLPTRVVALDHSHADKLAAALRELPLPIVARISEDRLVLDPRTVLPAQDTQLIDGVLAVMGKSVVSGES